MAISRLPLFGCRLWALSMVLSIKGYINTLVHIQRSLLIYLLLSSSILGPASTVWACLTNFGEVRSNSAQTSVRVFIVSPHGHVQPYSQLLFIPYDKLGFPLAQAATRIGLCRTMVEMLTIIGRKPRPLPPSYFYSGNISDLAVESKP